jgi:hypothetical protein
MKRREAPLTDSNLFAALFVWRIDWLFPTWRSWQPRAFSREATQQKAAG